MIVGRDTKAEKLGDLAGTVHAFSDPDSNSGYLVTRAALAEMGTSKLQSWLNFLSSEIHIGGFCTLFHPGMPAEAKQIFRERLAGRLTHLDQQLAKNEYLMGISFSLADIYLFVATNWARSVKLDLSP